MRRLIPLLVLALLSFPASAKMYKWTDEKGETHYGDTIPPQYATQPSSELSPRGTVLKKNEGALTPEQRKAKEEEAARQKEEKQKAQEQQRRDRALLSTYSSEAEIDRVRDRRLQQVQLQIQNIEVRSKAAQARLDKARSKGPASAEVKSAAAELQGLQDEARKKKLELDAARAKFDEDKRRFRELTSPK